MKPKDDLFIKCAVKKDSCADDAQAPAEEVYAQSVRKLVFSELGDSDLEELGFKRPPMKPSCVDGGSSAETMVNATIRVIADQINNLDVEAEMLTLRKRALKRRMRILERISKSLQSSDDKTDTK